MTLQELMSALYQSPETLEFRAVIETIDAEFDYTPSAFMNGNTSNIASENQGSGKVFSFARQAGLSEAHTLMLFAEHYRDVLANPDATNHQNIREFITNGWTGVSFAKPALKKRK